MRKSIIIFIILFVGIIVPMTLLSNHHIHNSEGCAASNFDTVVCPMSALSIVFHHISAYQSFSQNLLISGYVIFLIIASGLVLLLKLSPSSTDTIHPLTRLDEKKYLSGHILGRIQIWLVLLTNSPSLR